MASLTFGCKGLLSGSGSVIADLQAQLFRAVQAGDLKRAMQAAGDVFLSWATGTGEFARHFYFRQLSDAKIKPVVEIMKPVNLKNYARLCGRVLARAHARSSDPLVLTGYMGKSTAFEDALAELNGTVFRPPEATGLNTFMSWRPGKAGASQVYIFSRGRSKG